MDEQADYRIVASRDDLAAFVERIRGAGCVSVNSVTTDDAPMRAEWVGVALAAAAGAAIYVPVAHVGGPNLDLVTVLDVLKPVLEDAAIAKIGQDLKRDTVMFRCAGVRLQGVAFDAMLASYLIAPGRDDHDMEAICRTYLDRTPMPLSALIGAGKQRIGIARVAVAQAGNYACEGADFALQLRDVLAPKLDEMGLSSLFARVEMPLVEVLAEMEFQGMALNVPFLEEMASDLSFDLDRLSDEIFDLAGDTFNLNSTQQLAHVLFEKLGLPPGRKTKRGYSTDQSVLERLALLHPLPARFLAYRELVKLQSTYVEALPRLVHPKTGRVHASFNQAVTATGRLSASDPNVQNIPVRSEPGRQIRRAFVPGQPGRVLMTADYSQIELRIMAHLSGDAALIAAFESGEDVHRHTASLLFNLHPEYVTDAMRERAKTVNYGVIYGMGPFGLASRLGLTVGEARAFIERYFATYPGVRAFIAHTIEQAREAGYVTTLLGRRRGVPEIASTHRHRREAAERIAVNTPIQGTASDMIKVAMVRIFDRLKRDAPAAHMVLQVHDELVFETPESEVDALRDIVVSEMTGALALGVPVKVSVGIGKNWLEAH